MLSIVIPSYNRITLLEPTLYKLCKLLKGVRDIELILLDNNSSQPYQLLFDSIINKYELTNFKYIKNKFNVGGNQNILRCIEFSTYDWVWILGDDDEVADTCLQQITADIIKDGDACFIHYAQKVHRSENKQNVYYGRKEILRSSLKVNDLNFISSNLINKKYIGDDFFLVHLYEYSCAPLFYTLLLLAQKDNRVIVKYDPIIKEAAPNTSPELIRLSFYVMRGFLRLNELPLPKATSYETILFKIKCASVFYKWIRPQKLILSVFIDYYAHQNYFKFLYRYFYVGIKLLFVTFNPIMIVPFILCIPFLLIPQLFLVLLQFYMKYFKKQSFSLNKFKGVYLYD